VSQVEEANVLVHGKENLWPAHYIEAEATCTTLKERPVWDDEGHDGPFAL
jgi:hypothetical protein